MAETAGPFDTVSWSQDQWYRFAMSWAPSGVIDTPAASVGAGSLSLAASGLTLTLGAGRAWVRGGGYENTAAKTITVTANANTSARIDRLVLRRDLAAKTITPTLVSGTPGGAKPSLTQVETGAWDVPLFSWTTPANSGTALTGLTDERVWTDAEYQAGRLGGLSIVQLTSAAYAALGTKDAATLYVIVG